MEVGKLMTDRNGKEIYIGAPVTIFVEGCVPYVSVVTYIFRDSQQRQIQVISYKDTYNYGRQRQYDSQEIQVMSDEQAMLWKLEN